jgi:uncharacterized protein YjbJ (UPF0337 family)
MWSLVQAQRHRQRTEPCTGTTRAHFVPKKAGGKTMNEDTLKGQWLQLKGKIREQWGKLTDDDVDQIQGRAEQLIGRLENRYGIARDEAQRQVDAWLHNTRIEPSPSR